MPFNDTRTAIGAVGELLQGQLIAGTGAASVDVGRPEAAASDAGPKFNLFLYQIEMDGFLRNQPLDEGQKTPLWLVLRYLLTAFDADRESNSTTAHGLLGDGMLALQELNFLHPQSAPLADNPEPLKITFETAGSELLSSLMQATEDVYRVSTAFQIRPVMLVSVAQPSYAPVVRTVGAPESEGVVVIPSLGPELTGIEPELFEAGDTITLRGVDLATIQWIAFGETRYGVTAAPAGRLRTRVPVDTTLSPGVLPITAVRELPNGRFMSSNAAFGRMAPTLVGALAGLLSNDGFGNFFGDLVLSGTRLGGLDDDIYVAFFGAGQVQLLLEATGVPTQDVLNVPVALDDALPSGSYRIILRVNGVQAPTSPEVAWS